MSDLVTTIIAAIILMGLVVLALAIGWLLTGKSRLKKKCGFIPKKGEKEEDSCPYCGSHDICEKKDDEKK